MKKFLITFAGIAIIGALAYSYRGQLQGLFARFLSGNQPCAKPILYSIGTFDSRFGISRDYFLSALRDAEAIWEKPLGLNLFSYDPNGSLKINLIYDYRQQATVKLQKLGLTLNDDQATYDKLKAKYDALKAAYISDLAALKAKEADYQARQSAYEKELASWNAGRGGSQATYDKINADRLALNAEGAQINQLQTQLNDEVDTINALAVSLNSLVITLNLAVTKYNTVGGSLGGEFEEGDYQSSAAGQKIDIFEYSSRIKLVRLLAHELGHALGLDHLDDPRAIMYRLNNGVNGSLTAADLAAVKTLCGIK